MFLNFPAISSPEYFYISIIWELYFQIKELFYNDNIFFCGLAWFRFLCYYNFHIFLDWFLKEIIHSLNTRWMSYVQGRIDPWTTWVWASWVHLPLNFFSNMCHSTTRFAVNWIHGSSTTDLEEILIWRADNKLYSTVWRVSTPNLHVIWGWLTSEWTKYFTYIKHHLNIWDFVYKIIEQMEIKLQESRHSFQIWVCMLKIQVYHFIPSKQLRWSDLKDISTTN